MNELLSLTKRNMLMYIKDRALVFFSLLSMLIILLMFILFLAKMNIDSVQGIVSLSRETAAFLVNSWVMAAIIVVNSVTVTLGVVGIMVDDEVKHNMPAFLVSPVSRLKLALGYILSAFTIGNILCLLSFALSEAYIYASGGSLLTILQVLKAVGIIFASVFSSTCFVFFLVSLIRTTSTFTSVSILIGSIIGFAAGLYMPVGALPVTVQRFVKLLPIFYDSSLMRGIFMENPISIIFKDAPLNISSGYLKSMGVEIFWGDHAVSAQAKVVVILLSGIIFLVLSAVLMRKRKMSEA